MTLEAWVNPDRRSTAPGGTSSTRATTTTTWRRPRRQPGRPGGGGTFGGAYGETSTAPPRWPSNTWTHLAATYDGADAAGCTSTACRWRASARRATSLTSANPLQIGGDTIYGQYFAGRIDEVRVYNRALTATQIQADMAYADRGWSIRPDRVVSAVFDCALAAWAPPCGSGATLDSNVVRFSS